MKILILGGTGAMGIHLVNILAQNNQITVTSRKPRENKENVIYTVCNAHNIKELTPLLNQHFDAIVDFMIYTTEEFSSRVDRLLSSTNHYVFLSSSRVYADSSIPITEDSPRLLDICEDTEYLKTDEYALTKARQENLLFQSKFKNWTIIRPYITFSENRLQLGVLEKENWLYRTIHNRTIVFSKDIAQKQTTLTYGFDVARGIASIIGKEKAFAQAFHITSNEHYKWQDIFEIYQNTLLEVFGKKIKVLILDKSHVQKSNHYQINYDRLYNRVFDNTKISQFCDISNFHSVKEYLKECLASIVKENSFNHIDFAKEAKADKHSHEFTKLSEIKRFKQKIKYLLFRFELFN